MTHTATMDLEGMPPRDLDIEVLETMLEPVLPVLHFMGAIVAFPAGMFVGVLIGSLI